MTISLLTKVDKKNVLRFYKQERYSARFIGHDTCFIFTNKQSLIIASVIVSTIDNENFLHALVTQKDKQGIGIGSQLLKHCKANYDHLMCFADTELSAFYDSHDFHRSDKSSLNEALLKRWLSYQKKNPHLSIFRYR